MLSLATSSPAATSAASRSGLEDAGPSVQTIFARRLMLSRSRPLRPQLVYTTLGAAFTSPSPDVQDSFQRSSRATHTRPGPGSRQLSPREADCRAGHCLPLDCSEAYRRSEERRVGKEC